MTARSERARYSERASGLRRALRFLRRGLLWAAATAVVTVGAEFLVTRQKEPHYRATVTLLATRRQPDYAGLPVNAPEPIDPTVYRTVVFEGPIGQKALTKVLGHPPTAERLHAFLANTRIDVRNLDVSSILQVTTDSHDPRFAEASANTLATMLVQWDRARADTSVIQSIALLRSQIARIDASLGGATLDGKPLTQPVRASLQALRKERAAELDSARTRRDASVPVSLLQPVNSATLPERPTRDIATWMIVAAALLGAAGGYGIQWILGSRDPRGLNRSELESAARLPILAELPAAAHGNREHASVSIQALRSKLVVRAEGAPSYVIAVTSPRTGESKENVTLALAASLVQAGFRTLLVDADLRRPGLSGELRVPRMGVTSLEAQLEHPRLDASPAIINVDGARTCDFIPSYGPDSGPPELLERGLAERMRVWRKRYSFIILDCPPILPYAETLSILRHCSGAILCTRRMSSSRSDVAQSANLMRMTGTEALGLVVTNEGTNALATRHVRTAAPG